MKKRYLFPLINITALIGCGLAIFTFPPQTSYKLFAFISFGTIAWINIALFLGLRAANKRGYVAKPLSKLTLFVVWIAFLVFLAEAIRGFLKYWRAP